MLLVKARVGRSDIHGLGLIAQEFIAEGTVIWRLQPGFDVLLSEAEVEQLPDAARETVRHYGYFDQRIDRHVLSGDDDRFTNHSHHANVRFHGDHAIAVRDIQPGEEITDNYDEYGKTLQPCPWELR